MSKKSLSWPNVTFELDSSLYFLWNINTSIMLSPQYKLPKKFPLFSGAHCSSPEQPGSVGKTPELWGGFSARWGCTKRKLLDLLPVWDVSDPMAARAASQMSCLHPVLCCQLLWNSSGFVCLPKLPLTRPQTPLRAREALQELWGI